MLSVDDLNTILLLIKDQLALHYLAESKWKKQHTSSHQQLTADMHATVRLLEVTLPGAVEKLNDIRSQEDIRNDLF